MRSPLIALLVFAAACDKGEPPPELDPVGPPGAPSTPPSPPPLSEASLADVCSGKPAPAGVAAYEKKPGQLSPVLVFESHDGGPFESSTSMLRAWEPKSPDETQLVACLSRTGTKVKECEFDGEGKKNWLDLHDASYTLSLKEASTGKELLKTSFDAKSSLVCPFVSFFESERESQYASYEPGLLAAITDFQPPDAPALDWTHEESMLSMVCDGKGVTGAKKYELAEGSASRVMVFERSEQDPWRKVGNDSLGIPENWETERFGDMQLAACSTIDKADKIRSCKFDGGQTLDLYRAKYTVALREVATGKKIGEKEFTTGKKAQCPYIWGFDQDPDQNDVSYSELGDGVQKWMKPLVMR